MKELRDEYDVIIVGAGPSGSTCATFLGKKKVNTLLIDKDRFPRDKICGDAISGSLRIHNELKLTDEIKKKQHAEIHGVVFSSPNGKQVRIDFTRTGYTCMRKIYDYILVKKAKAEKTVNIVEGFEVKDIIFENSRVVGVSGIYRKKKVDIHAKIVVGADGAHSVVAKKTGCFDPDPKHTILAVRAYYKGVKLSKDAIELHFVDDVIPGYFWIFPVGNEISNVGIGMVQEYIKKRKKNLKYLMLNIIKENKEFKNRFKKAKMVTGTFAGWTLPVGSKRRKAHGNGFVLLGDAAGLIDPFTGEGISNAMYSSSIAAKWIFKALKNDDYSADMLKNYEDEIWHVLGNKMKTSYKLQRLGKFKFLINLVINKVQKSEQVKNILREMVDNVEERKGLANPLFYLKLLFA